MKWKESSGEKKKRIYLIDSTAPVIELSQVRPLMTCLTQEKRSIFLLGMHVSWLHIISLPHLKELRRARGDLFVMQDLSLSIYSAKAVLHIKLCRIACNGFVMQTTVIWRKQISQTWGVQGNTYCICGSVKTIKNNSNPYIPFSFRSSFLQPIF